MSIHRGTPIQRPIHFRDYGRLLWGLFPGLCSLAFRLFRNNRFCVWAWWCSCVCCSLVSFCLPNRVGEKRSWVRCGVEEAVCHVAELVLVYGCLPVCSWYWALSLCLCVSFMCVCLYCISTCFLVKGQPFQTYSLVVSFTGHLVRDPLTTTRDFISVYVRCIYIMYFCACVCTRVCVGCILKCSLIGGWAKLRFQNEKSHLGENKFLQCDVIITRVSTEFCLCALGSLGELAVTLQRWGSSWPCTSTQTPQISEGWFWMKGQRPSLP